MPWAFYKDSRSPDLADEYVEIAWEETPSGFEMRVARGRSGSKRGHKMARYAFSTAEELERAIQKCKATALRDGFKPSLDYSAEN